MESVRSSGGIYDSEFPGREGLQELNWPCVQHTCTEFKEKLIRPTSVSVVGLLMIGMICISSILNSPVSPVRVFFPCLILISLTSAVGSSLAISITSPSVYDRS